MKKIVFAGDRLFMKFPELGYFQERAAEGGRCNLTGNPDTDTDILLVRLASIKPEFGRGQEASGRSRVTASRVDDPESGAPRRRRAPRPAPRAGCGA